MFLSRRQFSGLSQAAHVPPTGATTNVTQLQSVFHQAKGISFEQGTVYVKVKVQDIQNLKNSTVYFVSII